METQQESPYHINWNEISRKYPMTCAEIEKANIGHSYSRLDIIADFFERNGFDISIDYQYVVKGNKRVLWKVFYSKGIMCTHTYGNFQNDLPKEYFTRRSAYYDAIHKCFELMEFSLND